MVNRIRPNHAPGWKAGPDSRPGIGPPGCGVVGHHHLFHQAGEEAGKPRLNLPRRADPVADLPGHVAVPDDGPGHQLVEGHDIHQMIGVAGLGPHRPPVHIQNVGQALEDIEGDPDGEGNLRHRQPKAGQLVEVSTRKPVYLKKTSIPRFITREPASATLAGASPGCHRWPWQRDSPPPRQTAA